MPKISIEQKTPSRRELIKKLTARTLEVMGSTKLETVLGVPNFESVHEDVKVKLNSVYPTEFS